MRNIKCPKYHECLSEAAKLNIGFNCRNCKKQKQNLNSSSELETHSKPIMFKIGGTGERNRCKNECVRCQWRNSCKNAKPKCYESINKKGEEDVSNT